MTGEEQLDGLAWLWLTSQIPRLDVHEYGYKRVDTQIIIRAMPRKGIGQPMVRVSVDYPGINRRVTGSGNSLWEAIQFLAHDLRSRGAEIVHPLVWEVYQRQRAEWFERRLPLTGLV